MSVISEAVTPAKETAPFAKAECVSKARNERSQARSPARNQPSGRSRSAPRVKPAAEATSAGREAYAALLDATACHGEALLLADLADDPYWPDHTRR